MSLALIDKVISRVGSEPHKLLEVLSELQWEKDEKYLTNQELKEISKRLNVSGGHICSTLSFYTLLSTKPRGKYVIQICKDPSCHIDGTHDMVQVFTEILGIKMGETTEDKMFTLEYTSCIGCCDESPAVRIHDTLHTKMTQAQVKEVIEHYKGEKK